MNWTDLTGQRPGVRGVWCRWAKRLTFGGLELLGLGSTSDTTGESSERNDLLLLLDIGEVGVRLLQGHA